MKSLDFKFSGAEDLAKAFEMAAKQFPHYTELVLKDEAKDIAGDLKAKVQREVWGHGEKPGTLEKKFVPGKVMKKKDDYTVSVDSKAPHYHLVEEGHDMYTLSNWKKAGDRRRFYGDTKLAGEVPGRKFVARYMAARAERASLLMAEATLDKILKGAGL